MKHPYTVLDLSQYPRRAHFDYFRQMAYPYVGVTCDVDVTELVAQARVNKQPFFLTLLWYVSQAANAVPEFRQRIRGDSIVQYDWCPTSHTVAREDGTYSYCELDASMPLADYLPQAIALQREAKEHGSIHETDMEPLLFVSTVPWLHYTSLTQPVPSPADSNPRITWGKYAEHDGRLLLPMTLLCHHALVDGLHLAQFYEHLVF